MNKKRMIDWWTDNNIPEQHRVVAKALVTQHTDLVKVLEQIELDCSGMMGNISTQTSVGREARKNLERIAKRARAGISMASKL